MHSCTCAPARTSAPSASTVPLSFSSTAAAALPERIEQAVDLLTQVREYLRLLADCAGASTDHAVELPTESLAIALTDQAEQLGIAEKRLDALTRGAPAAVLDAIEAEILRVHAVRHLLQTLHAALGVQSRDRQPVQVEALAGTMLRLSERIGVIEAALLATAFGCAVLPVMPVMPASPSTPPPVETPVPVDGPCATMPPAPRPVRPARPVRLVRSARQRAEQAARAQEVACA